LKSILALALILLAFAAMASERSRAQVDAFKRMQPCPITGKARGACPGYEVEHIIPLKCKGLDRPANMQWRTVQAHTATPRAEAKSCRR